MRQVLIIFGQLADSDVLWLARAGRRRRVKQGTVLIQEGVAIDTLYILLTGALDVVVEARQSTAARLLPGEMVGEMSFIEARPPSATVRAVTDSMVYAISKDKLQNHLTSDASFATRFYKALAMLLSVRVRQMTAGAGQGAGGRDEQDELDEKILDNVDRAGARFDELSHHLMEE